MLQENVQEGCEQKSVGQCKFLSQQPGCSLFKACSCEHNTAVQERLVMEDSVTYGRDPAAFT